jgi:hypothetical protein
MQEVQEEVTTEQVVVEAPKPFRYNDYYNAAFLDDQAQLAIRHIFNKFENEKGVLVVMRAGIASYYGINNSDVLRKGLEYYNKQGNQVSAFWFKVEDIAKRVTE